MSMKSRMLNSVLWGIRGYEYLAVLVFYFFCALSYRVTVWISGHKAEAALRWETLLDWNNFLETAGLDYTIKLLLTVPIWWLIFQKFKNLKLGYRLLFHIICLPIFIAVFKYVYYEISAWLDWWRLTGGGQIWDIYIPGLFYLIQFGLFHAYEYYQNNERNLKLKAQLREAALNSELSALKAQLNPHFLYNVFNTISASISPEQEQAREMLAQLSDLFRYQLKASKSDVVRLEEELQFIEKYLALEKARFEDRLEVEIDVPVEVRQELVPPMILQPLVENAIKHGISPLIQGGKVSIHSLKYGKQIYFKISDTGVGVKDKSILLDKGIGFTNTKLRLEKQYGSEMIISDNEPHGLVIEFSINVYHGPKKTVQEPKPKALIETTLS